MHDLSKRKCATVWSLTLSLNAECSTGADAAAAACRASTCRSSWSHATKQSSSCLWPLYGPAWCQPLQVGLPNTLPVASLLFRLCLECCTKIWITELLKLSAAVSAGVNSTPRLHIHVSTCPLQAFFCCCCCCCFCCCCCCCCCRRALPWLRGQLGWPHRRRRSHGHWTL